MALSENTIRAYSLGDKNQLPVKATSVIYLGSAVGMASGYARALVAGDKFAGFALEKKTGGATDGLITVEVQAEGIIQVAVSSAAVDDIGKRVYASDDGTFTYTQSTNSPVGIVRRYVSSGQVEVAFSAERDAVSIAALTDNSGGTANDTLQACGTAVTGVDGTGSNAASKADVDARLTAIANNFADLAAKVNELIKSR